MVATFTLKYEIRAVCNTGRDSNEYGTYTINAKRIGEFLPEYPGVGLNIPPLEFEFANHNQAMLCSCTNFACHNENWSMISQLI